MKIIRSNPDLEGTPRVTVVLSERNLRDLLTAWEFDGYAMLRRMDTSAGTAVAVTVESNEAHYAGRALRDGPTDGKD